MRHERCSVLLVDDDALVRRVERRLFTGAGFARVDEAADGAQALVALSARHYDLVITDWQMPVLDGAGLLTALRRWPERCDTPVLVLSGSAPGADALEAGANGLLAKPCTPEALLTAVDEVLAMYPEPPGAAPRPSRPPRPPPPSRP